MKKEENNNVSFLFLSELGSGLNFSRLYFRDSALQSNYFMELEKLGQLDSGLINRLTKLELRT